MNKKIKMNDVEICKRIMGFIPLTSEHHHILDESIKYRYGIENQIIKFTE